jgi:hypothetical protein
VARVVGGFLSRNGYRNRGEFGGEAKIGQALEQTFCLLLLGTAVEVIGAEVVVLIATLEHVISSREDRSGHGADRLLGSASRAHAVELGLDIAGLLAAGGPSALHRKAKKPGRRSCTSISRMMPGGKGRSLANV